MSAVNEQAIEVLAMARERIPRARLVRVVDSRYPQSGLRPGELPVKVGPRVVIFKAAPGVTK